MSADPDEQIFQRIAMRLEALGLSERAVTKKAKLSPSAIRNMREGKSRSPRIDTIRKLAPALEVTPEWLTFGIDADTEIKSVNPGRQANERHEFRSLMAFIEVLEPSDMAKALRILAEVFGEKETFERPPRQPSKRPGNTRHS